MIPFCFTRFFLLGAMVRWPFLGPRAEGLRDEEEEEDVGLRVLTAPCAMVGGEGCGAV